MRIERAPDPANAPSERFVDRAMALLAAQAPRFGLNEALARELIPPTVERVSPDPET
jgi:hypothetical protein